MRFQSNKSRNANCARTTSIPQTFIICTAVLSMAYLFISYSSLLLLSSSSSSSSSSVGSSAGKNTDCRHDRADTGDYNHYTKDSTLPFQRHDQIQHNTHTSFVEEQKSNRQMTMVVNTTTTTTGSSSSNNDPSGSIHCKQFLQDFRQGKITEIERIKGYEKPFVTRTDTPKPFYWSLHDPKLDPTRSSSYQKGYYYEKELSQRIIDVFENVTSHNNNNPNTETIMLDVGGNLGWFSLLAAAHGASKVYMFEPNPSNLVRFCESLQLNDWAHDDPSQGFVFPIGKGVSNEIGKMKFYRVVENNPGTYSFSETRLIRNSKEMKQAFLDQNTTAIEERVLGEIELITLDAFAESMGWFETKPMIAFFKLDVEGFEPQIIYGGKKLFGHRLVEFFSVEIKPVQTLHRDKRDIIKIMLNNGYELYMHGAYLGPNTLVEKSYTHYKELLSDISSRVYAENLLFRKKENWKKS